MAAPKGKTSKGQTPRVLKRREWWKQRQVNDGTTDCPGEEMDAQSMEHSNPKQSRADGSETNGLCKHKSDLGVAVSKPRVKRQAASVGENEGTGFTKKIKRDTEAYYEPAAFSNEQDELEEVQGEEVHEKHPAKRKKQEAKKKSSREKNASADVSPDEGQVPADSSSKKKKPKKASGALTESADSQTSCSPVPRQHRQQQQQQQEQEHETQMHAARNSGGQKVYCVFVGNLPYDVTKEQLSEHFSVAGNIKAIRIPTAKDTGKPRGFAYIEFKDKHSHRLGLGLHHTELGNRVINVEFTSAGGRCEKRLEHLRQKNQALERFKRLPWS